MTTMSKETLTDIEEEEEGQWKDLPNDILALILQRFHTKPDLCRFRSICKSWRSFATPIQPHLLFPLILPPLHPGSSCLSLSPRFTYIFSPNFTPLHHHHHHNNINDYWLTKVEEVGDISIINNNNWSLLNPLTNEKLYYEFPMVSRNVLNLLGFRNHEVGRSYCPQYVYDDDDITFKFVLLSSSIVLRKVAVLIKERVSVLGLNAFFEIVLWNYGDQNWKRVDAPEIKKKMDDFDDIICYDGKFYAVDRTGGLVIINPTNVEDVQVISSTRVFDDYNQYIYLVESDFRLYMVTKMVNSRLSNFFDDEDDDDEEEEKWLQLLELISDDDDASTKPLGFEVYVLNEREKSWERVYSLGNKVFFVSNDTVFSASAANLGLSKKNCIYFEADMGLGNAGVYSLEEEAFVACDSTARIFCLPMSWFVQNEEYLDCEMED